MCQLLRAGPGVRVTRLLVTFLGSQLDKPRLFLVATNRVHVNIAVIINATVLYILVFMYLLEIKLLLLHYIDVIMTTVASQITSLTIVYSIVYSGTDQGKHQSSTSLAFVQGIHRDWWIPSTKGQLRGKCFHLLTSPWIEGSVAHEIGAVIEDTYMGHKAKIS